MFRIRKPRLRVTSRGLRVTSPGVRIGGKHAWLNVSRRGASVTGRAGHVSYNTRRGCMLFPLLLLTSGLLFVLLAGCSALSTSIPLPTTTLESLIFSAPQETETFTPTATVTLTATRTITPTRTATPTRTVKSTTAARTAMATRVLRPTSTPFPTIAPIMIPSLAPMPTGSTGRT